MITIKTEKHTYTAKMGAEESEKLFRELVMQLFGYTGQLSIPEIGAAVIPEIHACVSKKRKGNRRKARCYERTGRVHGGQVFCGSGHRTRADQERK